MTAIFFDGTEVAINYDEIDRIELDYDAYCILVTWRQPNIYGYTTERVSKISI